MRPPLLSSPSPLRHGFDSAEPPRVRGATPLALLFVCLSLSAPPLGAELQRFTLDPARSRVEIRLGATLHTVEGTARIARGSLRFDTQTGEAHGQAVVDARSAETGIAARDARMHSEVLESERYPEIVFEASRIELLEKSAGDARFILHGELSIHGSVHLIALRAHAVSVSGDAVRVTSEIELPYVEWGMKDVSTFLLRVAPNVTVSLDLRGEFR